MKDYELRALAEIAREYGLFEKLKGKKAQNVLDNSMWSNMIDGALKALEIIAVASLDWKLTAIVKLLQSWLKDRKEEQAKAKQKKDWGYGYYADTYSNQYNQPGTYY